MKKFKTLGSDPEFIVVDSVTGEAVAMCGYLGGEKGSPRALDIAGCGVEEDNVLVELTVPPSQNLTELAFYIEEARKCVADEIAKLNPNWVIVAKSSAHYGEDQLCSEKAMTFGCHPSLSIYVGTSQRPGAKEVGSLRSAGFHLHFGWENEDMPTESELRDFIFLCDLFLGVPSIIFDKDMDRRKIYGNLGDYRFTKYGIEYRSMGSGMYNFLDVVQAGLDKIQENLDPEKIKELKELYWETMDDLDAQIKQISSEDEQVVELYNELKNA